MFRLAFWLAIIYFVVGLFHPELATTKLGEPEPETVVEVGQSAPKPPAKVYDEDGCNIDVDSKLVAEHEVGRITNLEEERFEFGMKNECSVSYDIAVDGQTHHVEQTESGLEQMNSICYYARENGRKNLLLNLPGKFSSHANIECKYKDTIGKSAG